jgi:hypothetical protein
VQGRAVDVLADDEGLATDDVGVEHPGGEVGGLLGRGDLAQQLLTCGGMPGNLGTKQLDRDIPARGGRGLRIAVGKVDHTLSTLPKTADEMVAADVRRVGGFQWAHTIHQNSHHAKAQWANEVDRCRRFGRGRYGRGRPGHLRPQVPSPGTREVIGGFGGARAFGQRQTIGTTTVDRDAEPAGKPVAGRPVAVDSLAPVVLFSPDGAAPGAGVGGVTWTSCYWR